MDGNEGSTGDGNGTGRGTREETGAGTIMERGETRKRALGYVTPGIKREYRALQFRTRHHLLVALAGSQQPWAQDPVLIRRCGTEGRTGPRDGKEKTVTGTGRTREHERVRERTRERTRDENRERGGNKSRNVDENGWRGKRVRELRKSL